MLQVQINVLNNALLLQEVKQRERERERERERGEEIRAQADTKLMDISTRISDVLKLSIP